MEMIVAVQRVKRSARFFRRGRVCSVIFECSPIQYSACRANEHTACVKVFLAIELVSNFSDCETFNRLAEPPCVLSGHSVYECVSASRPVSCGLCDLPKSELMNFEPIN